MTKQFFLLAIILLAVAANLYSSARQTTTGKYIVQPTKVTYNANIKPLIVAKCGPCHLDEGKEVSYDNYTSAKESIDEILHSIKLNPGQHGYMPEKNPKLPDSVIHIFEQWKIDSLLEK